MAGNQTHGFDMVIEISDQTIQNLLSATFDSEGLLGSLTSALGVIEEFHLTTNFDRPTSLIPSNAENPIDLTFQLKLAGNNSATLRIVVGVTVDRTDSKFDKVLLNFKDKMYHFELTGTGLAGIALNLAKDRVKDFFKTKQIPIMPIPVKRNGATTMQIKKVDVKIIDDSSTYDNDSLGIILTYGGGSAGQINNFTESFSRKGAGAAVAINFAWICRNISPRIENGLGLSSGAFSGCSFNGNHEIRDGVYLKEMKIKAEDDHIALQGKVAKSGTCYSASGKFSAQISVSIINGELRVSFNLDNPNIDIDIPWYCWLGVVVIGAITGGIFGAIGAIVGGIIAPLILWIAQSVVESTVENVTQQVTNSINGIEDISLQLVGINTVLDKAFIDDLTVTYEMFPEEYSPIKSNGYVTLKSGEYLDLDRGVVKNSPFGGADIAIGGTRHTRSIRILCGSTYADMNPNTPLSKVRKYQLYFLNYGAKSNIELSKFATAIPLPIVPTIYYLKNHLFALRTSENSYAFFRVVSINDNDIRLYYKTYESNIHTIDITGEFKCPIHYDYYAGAVSLDFVSYKDSLTLNNNFTQNAIQNKLEATAATLYSEKGIGLGFGAESEEEEEELSPVHTPRGLNILAEAVRLDSKQTDKFIEQQHISNQVEVSPVIDRYKDELSVVNRGAGIWYEHYVTEREVKSAKLYAKVNGTVEVVNYTWIVNNETLPQNGTGTLSIQNHNFEYKTSDKWLTLSSNAEIETSIAVKLIVTFADGTSNTKIRCINYKNECKLTVRKVPLFKEFAEMYDSEHGIITL